MFAVPVFSLYASVPSSTQVQSVSGLFLTFTFHRFSQSEALDQMCFLKTLDSFSKTTTFADVNAMPTYVTYAKNSKIA